MSTSGWAYSCDFSIYTFSFKWVTLGSITYSTPPPRLSHYTLFSRHTPYPWFDVSRHFNIVDTRLFMLAPL